jgi:hypothetical protein
MEAAEEEVCKAPLPTKMTDILQDAEKCQNIFG